jgi:excinuclease ABC subunit C
VSLPAMPECTYIRTHTARSSTYGKAKNLRSRVRSYFNDERLADVKTGTLIQKRGQVDFIQVDNEKEALALENNLIKQWKPRYNILLRDDKTYPYIKLTAERYPARLRDPPR